MKVFFEYMRKQNVWSLMTAFALGTLVYKLVVENIVGSVIYPLISYYLQFTGLFAEAATLGEGAERVQINWGAALGWLIVFVLTVAVIWFAFWAVRMFEKKVLSQKFFSKKKKK